MEITNSDPNSSEKNNYDSKSDYKKIKSLNKKDNSLIYLKSISPHNFLEKRCQMSKRALSQNAGNLDNCKICKNEGELVLCNDCPRSFNLNCLELKKNEINADWFCATCK